MTFQTDTDTTRPPPGDCDQRSPLRHGPSHLRVWIPAIIGVAADLWSKDWAFKNVDGQMPMFPGILGFHLSLNPGALFGLGAGLAPIFVGASALALLFVLYLFAQSTTRHWGLHMALGMVLAGAVGNLYDRTNVLATVVTTRNGTRDIGRISEQGADGAWITMVDFATGAHPRTYLVADLKAGPSLQPVVRDFIEIQAGLGKYRAWPWIFNIADVLLVVGVGMLLISFWFDRRHHVAGLSPPGQPRQVVPAADDAPPA